MAQLLSTSIKRGDLETIVKAMKAKEAAGDENGGKYFNLTISVNDDAPRFGQNVSMYASQSKEDRDAKKPKFYIGNGKTVWAGNGEFMPPKYDPNAAAPAAAPSTGKPEDDLPF